MRVRENDVEALVLTVLDELYIGPGGQVHPETLFQEWPKIGLRTSDLEQALEALKSKGAIQVDKTVDNSEMFVLTRQGHDRMLKLNSPFTLGLSGYQRLRRNAERRLRERQASAGQVQAERRRAQAGQQSSQSATQLH